MRIGLSTPVVMGLPGVVKMLAAVTLPPDFEVALPCGPLDPTGAPDGVRRRLDSPTHFCEQLSALRALADDNEGHTT